MTEDVLNLLEEQEEASFLTATVGEVKEDGVTLIFPGEETASEKVYKCNAGVIISAGDRVKIIQDSGTCVVEYVIGSPNSKILPSGGTAGQILTKTSTGYGWTDAPTGLPSGGTTGQYLQRTASGYGWSTPETSSLPSGGSANQVLAKTSTGSAWNSYLYAPTAKGSTGQSLILTSSGSNWAYPTLIKNGSSYSNYRVEVDSSGNVNINGNKLAFFGASGYSKQYLSTSATTSQIVTALKNYGLFS